MADMMMATGINAARYLDLQLTDIPLPVDLLETLPRFAARS